MLKLGRYWPQKTVSSHLNNRQPSKPPKIYPSTVKIGKKINSHPSKLPAVPDPDLEIRGRAGLKKKRFFWSFGPQVNLKIRPLGPSSWIRHWPPHWDPLIGHFWIAPILCFIARVSSTPLWIWNLFLEERSALGLSSKVRVLGTRKWPIIHVSESNFSIFQTPYNLSSFCFERKNLCSLDSANTFNNMTS